MQIQSKTDFSLFKKVKLSARVKFGKTLVENAQAWAMSELPFSSRIILLFVCAVGKFD